MERLINVLQFLIQKSGKRYGPSNSAREFYCLLKYVEDEDGGWTLGIHRRRGNQRINTHYRCDPHGRVSRTRHSFNKNIRVSPQRYVRDTVADAVIAFVAEKKLLGDFQ